ncbi:dihydrodipicolinate synthase family protein [Kiloniella sp. b19]|uniref:dihydrodipicolinate synthase family protein n=1 Tax=Kiloniella sp. GXU_MW_B19 TaxID=3141326 RepID=UPI0031D351FE
MADLAGINLAMQTPFHEDSSINYARWEELIDIYIDAGVHGLVFGSGTGQHPYLSEEESNRLYELGLKRVNGRCKVICQSSALNMEEIVRRSRHSEDHGADALMILPPYLEGPDDDDGLFEFYREIDAAISTDIVGYNIPQATGLSVSPALLDRLGDLPNFNYIKDSSGDMTIHQVYLRNKKVRLLNGADTTAVFSFMAGAYGSIWGGANYMPHECVKLWDLVQAGDHAGALELWKKMEPSLSWIWRHNYFSAVKSAVRVRGYEGGSVRKPQRPLSEQEEREFFETLACLDA